MSLGILQMPLFKAITGALLLPATKRSIAQRLISAAGWARRMAREWLSWVGFGDLKNTWAHRCSFKWSFTVCLLRSSSHEPIEITSHKHWIHLWKVEDEESSLTPTNLENVTLRRKLSLHNVWVHHCSFNGHSLAYLLRSSDPIAVTSHKQYIFRKVEDKINFTSTNLENLTLLAAFGHWSVTPVRTFCSHANRAVPF